MRIIKLLTVLIFAFICNTASSQVIKWNFFNYSHIPFEDGNAIVSAISSTPFKVNFTLSRPVIQPWVGLPIKGELELFFNYLGQERVLYSTPFTTSDWQSGSALSNVITKDVVFPQILTNSLRSVDVNVRYRYYRDKYPDPENTDGWTDWYMIPNTTKFMLSNSTLPESIITGPSQICDEGIYTITNPYVISLENAAGIATLTDMGLNKWKVTRNGQANGTVKLRSHSSSNVKFEKEIVIGAKIFGDISGPTTVFPGKSYEYNLILSDNISNYQNLTFTGTSGMTMQILSPTKVKYTVLSNFAFAPGETERNTTIEVTANIPGCGNTSIEFPIVVVNPKPTPIN